jgi:XTP/dITP diphosphohydrolase
VKLVLASANLDKVKEIRELLSDFEVLPRPEDLPDVDETGETLEDNARLKAVAVADATGQAAVADDTGLEVAALDGAPAVLDGVENRRARFRTVALVRFADGREVVAEGAVDGVIAEAPRGSAGFGYDPLFIPDEGDGRTFAEMTAAEKHDLSHRGRAFRALALRLVVDGR